jgi:hypothetical protein
MPVPTSSWQKGAARALKPKSLASVLGGRAPNSLQSSAARTLNPPPSAPVASPPSASAASSGPPPLPPDATYDQQVAAYGQRRDDTIAGYEGQKTSALADYGYGATYDADGNVASLTVDPNNPYSRAAQLKRSYDQSKTGTTNSLAARGQLYSGAMTNAQDANDRGYLQGQNDQQESLGAILAGIIGGERTARTDYQTNAAGAYGERVGRVPDDPLYSPTPAAAADPTTTAGVVAMLADAPKITGTYKNSSGRDTRVFQDGHKEVLVNGQWKRV